MGMRTMQLVDFMVKQRKWTMVTCNGGNFGRGGDKREQQLVFRSDEFVQHGSDHIMVELRTGGYVEVNGLHDAGELRGELDAFVKREWGCTDYKPYMWESSELYCDHKYTVPNAFFRKGCPEDGLTTNLNRRTLELSSFMASQGWALLLCNGGSMQPHPRDHPNLILRELQVKFTRARTAERAAAPLLMVQFRTLPTCDRPCSWDSLIEITGPDTKGVYSRLDDFVQKHMNASVVQHAGYCDKLYACNTFRLKACAVSESGRREGYLKGESNIGQWTMRICDFLVDHVGEWDLIVCNSDNLSRSFRHGSGDKKYYESVTAREMQMVFRHRPGGRAVFMSVSDETPLGRPPMQAPKYWTEPSRRGEIGHKIVAGSPEELAWAQEVLDKTFKQKATRDRDKGEALADHFSAVSCLRSEHPALWDKYAKRRQEVMQVRQGAESEFIVPKTMECKALVDRCTHAKLGNPTNQAYLLHGTNPTSAVAILGRSFAVNLAGASVGTMFGPGVYLAESSTKADEYARDDVGGEYAGLYAVLFCRAVLGRPFVTENPGDYAEQVTSGEYDHVLGDREKAVGTFREFVFFHEASIYPEYAVFYRREKDGKIIVPEPREDAPRQEEMHTE